MKLFRTKTKHTSYRTQPKRVGYVHTSKAKTRLKRWFRRSRKKLWRKAKQRVRRRWKQHQRKRQRRNATHNRQLARSQQPSGSYQVDASGGVSYQPGPAGEVGGQANLPPPDGVIGSCRRCGYEVQYNGGRQRWEHTGRGHTECFKRHRI